MKANAPPLHVILYRPQIPPNTGSIARTCAATGAHLHLVGPLGFSIDDRQVKRAGLDYWPHVQKSFHEKWEAFLQAAPNHGIKRIHALSSKVQPSFWNASFEKGDALLFGREDAGLPADLSFPDEIQVQRWRVPIHKSYVRSLNLSVCVGVVLFEALRKVGFEAVDTAHHVEPMLE